MQLQRVHAHLRAELRSLSSEEIRLATGVDIEASPELLNSLQGEAAKVRREKDGRWRWKSRHYIPGFQQLLQFFSSLQEGVPETALLDCYKGVKDDIKKLKEQGMVYALKAKGGSRVVLHRREKRLELDVSQDVRDKFSLIILPDRYEVHRYLVGKGLKEVDDEKSARAPGSAVVKRKRPGGGQGKAKRAKKIKLTNTHMTGLDGVDLTTDFKHGKNSAFQ